MYLQTKVNAVEVNFVRPLNKSKSCFRGVVKSLGAERSFCHTNKKGEWCEIRLKRYAWARLARPMEGDVLLFSLRTV